MHALSDSTDLVTNQGSYIHLQDESLIAIVFHQVRNSYSTLKKEKGLDDRNFNQNKDVKIH